VSGVSVGGQTQPVVINSAGKLGTATVRSASTAALATTVERLQRQVDRLREQLQRGG
jgi:polyhydroxyalkanoate synthesis regulator phasin